MTQLPELLTADEVGAVYRVSAATVRRWAAEKRIDSVRTPGGGLLFPRSALPTSPPSAEPEPAAVGTS